MKLRYQVVLRALLFEEKTAKLIAWIVIDIFQYQNGLLVVFTVSFYINFYECVGVCLHNKRFI